MSNEADKAIRMLDSLECSKFYPRTQNYKILLDKWRACSIIKDQDENISCVCSKVEEVMMELKGVIDDYPI